MTPLAMFGSASFVGLTLLTLLLYGALGGADGAGALSADSGLRLCGTPAGAPWCLFPGLAVGSPLMGGWRAASAPACRWRWTAGCGGRLPARFAYRPRPNYWTRRAACHPGDLRWHGGRGRASHHRRAGAVDARHTGSASGFNSAIARTGGLVATALLGAGAGGEGGGPGPGRSTPPP